MVRVGSGDGDGGGDGGVAVKSRFMDCGLWLWLAGWLQPERLNGTRKLNDHGG